jgi:hypothetical protein
MFSVLEHKTNGERSLVLWDCQFIRNETALHCGLAWIDKSCNYSRVQLIPRMATNSIITIDFPSALRGLATTQVIPDVIFRIESIN